MPSLNKTANLGLNQWQGNEYPKRLDFVEDNAAIDAAVGKPSELITTDKTNLVAAINEVETQINNLDADALVFESVFNSSGDLNTANKINKWYKIDNSAGVLNTPPTILMPDSSWTALYVQGNSLATFTQTLYSGGYNKILKRSYFSGTWTTWKEIATIDDLNSKLTINTVLYTDLDSLKTTGFFCFLGTGVNGFDTGSLWNLKVEAGEYTKGSGNITVTQTVTCSYSSNSTKIGEIKQRTYYVVGEWSSWKNINVSVQSTTPVLPITGQLWAW